MVFTQSQAIHRAASWVGHAYPVRSCQTWVVIEVFASGGVGDLDHNGRASALDGWKGARQRIETSDPMAIPAGLPVYFTGGPDGHAAVSAGGGDMFSTDLPAMGRIGRVPIRLAEQRWGYRFVGAVVIDHYGHDFRDPKPKISIPGPPLGDEMAYPVRNTATGGIYVVSPGRIKHIADGKNFSTVKNVLTTEDTIHQINAEQFAAFVDAMSIPVGVVDDRGNVLNPATGQHERGGAWSDVLAARA